jgi:radical SAM superfamily enzyme YgiQ (UPF0313 family)
MDNLLDLLVIKPGSQKTLYGVLSNSLSGLEPPLWGALLSAFIRHNGFNVKMVDTELEPERVREIIFLENPKLIAIVVSGTNPSASTMNMIGARALLEEIKKLQKNSLTILVGLHPSALPKRTIEEEPVSFVCEGEGFFTLLGLLQGKPHFEIQGLWYKENGKICSNARAKLANPDDLPMPAWDLLPMQNYRAHNWHCFGSLDKRSPYGVIYTSLGCPFNCSFCCINAIFGEHRLRLRSLDKVIEEIDYLVHHFGIRNIKIIDEMFAFDVKRVIDLCDRIIDKKYDLNIWAYARVDTIDPRMLQKMKKAGINWLGIGFESGSKKIRDKVSKGKFDNEKIKSVAKMIHDAGLYINGNFIFGLPDDDLATMQETLDLAKELNCEYGNFYVTMAYPGSKLYEEAKKDAIALPKEWVGYSQLNFETFPLATKHLSNIDVLAFRDKAFNEFYANGSYLDMIEKKFGMDTVEHVKDMLKFKLKRRLLENL